MQLQTIIEIPKSEWKISHSDKILLIGSCFADEVGEKLVRSGFQTDVNPFGTLYNPASIAASIEQCLDGEEYTAESPDVFQDSQTGMWHSWMHHTRFSATTCEELLRRMNETMYRVGEELRTGQVLIITLGTAIIYRLTETGRLVANCHKQPDRFFTRQALSAEEITTQWNVLLARLCSINPNLHVILTVSPIRHKRDGMHANQVSKGILLQAADRIESVQYFPSYEIMMDELRDYRFYTEDLVHPSPLAVEYIWERFQQTYLNRETIEACRLREKQYARSQHRPLIG